jgi:hypothetical protein
LSARNVKDASTRTENQKPKRKSNTVDAKAMLTGKTARLVAGAIVACLGFVLMYHEKFGIHINPEGIIGNVPLDIVGGAVFVIGVFLGASGMRED